MTGTNPQVSGSAEVAGSARVYGSAEVAGSAWVSGSARVSGTAQVYGSARVSGTAQVHGSARVYGSAQVHGSARVYGSAQVHGSARVYGSAWVSGSARVSGSAQVHGAGDVAHQGHVAWVDRVGTGQPMTLHRIRLDGGGYGWQINAGCRRWKSATVSEVCEIVEANVKAGPNEWAVHDLPTRVRWTKQTLLALAYLASMVDEDES